MPYFQVTWLNHSHLGVGGVSVTVFGWLYLLGGVLPTKVVNASGSIRGDPRIHQNSTRNEEETGGNKRCAAEGHHHGQTLGTLEDGAEHTSVWPHVRGDGVGAFIHPLLSAEG